MRQGHLEIQDQWSDEALRESWSRTPDDIFGFGRVAEATLEVTSSAAAGRLLDVAAAEGTLTCLLSLRGLATVAVEPSPLMLATARERMVQYDTTFALVRGIAETLPFPDAAFDRVLCHSALDHLADPERGIREMARVTRPGGTLVLTFMNYGGLTVRLSRALYRAGRKLGWVAPDTAQRLFWDTPVPMEHNFECTLANLSAMCRPYLEPDYMCGVSLGWGFPGWGRLLRRFRTPNGWLAPLDRFARLRPALADFVVSTWRPRPSQSWPVDNYRVRPSSPVYQRLIRKEADYWAAADFAMFFGHTGVSPAANLALTGDATRSWIADLAGRGPFRDVAVLGCDDLRWDADWLRHGASPRLDVYELSPKVIDKVKPRLGDMASRVRFIATDLNFVELPAAAYDCVWASGTMHLLTNLEHVFDQVQRALRPGGLFAIHGWVGEDRMQYDEQRLARVNALLAEVPARFRRVERVERPSTAFQLSPFTGVRSSEIIGLARTHPGFELLHEGCGLWLFPLAMVVDCDGLAREHPEVLHRLQAAEVAARTDPALRPAMGYIVLRRR